MSGGRLGRRLLATHLAVAAAALAALALGRAGGLPMGAALALSGAVALMLAGVAAAATGKWISRPLEEVEQVLLTAFSGRAPRDCPAFTLVGFWYFPPAPSSMYSSTEAPSNRPATTSHCGMLCSSRRTVLDGAPWVTYSGRRANVSSVRLCVVVA